MQSMTVTKWEAPGRGAWELNAANFPRPATRFYAEILEEQFPAGLREGTRRYGLLLDCLEYRYVNGFAYYAPRVVGAPRNATALPPKQVFKLAIAVHPALRRRLRTCETLFERKLWREDLQLWDHEAKPRSIQANLALQSTHPSTLSLDAALQYLDRCREHFKRMVYQRGRFTMTALVPTGDFLAHAKEWTGLPSVKLLNLLRGATPPAAGASNQLDRLLDAVQADPAALALLRSRKPAAEVIAGFPALTGAVAAAFTDYLDYVGYRIVGGYDPGDSYALEMPEMILRGLQSAVNGKGPSDAPHILSEEVSGVRRNVPPEARPLFDELLAEARAVQRVRDERGLLGDLWAAGIMRRAIFAVGKRLVELRRISEPGHLLEASYEEMRALARNRERPSASELAGRARYRATRHSLDAPPRLGPKPAEPPPYDWLPPMAARATRALYAIVEATFGEPQAQLTERTIHGIAASYGVQEGAARVVLGPQDFGRVQPGDVLITRATSPAFNIVLPLLGAVVTDRGGVLSHAAIVAREYGIPAVVGTRDATARIPSGALVRVNGTAGDVTILS
jgi:pyruvate,water dikinase